MTKKEYKNKKKRYVEDELKFKEDVEFIVFKYAYRLPLSWIELRKLKCCRVIETSKEWKKYIYKTYNKKRRKMIEFSEMKEIEYSVYEDFNSGLILAVLASLLVLLIQGGKELLNGVDFSDASILATLIVSGIFAFAFACILAIIIFIVAYYFTGDMMNRKYKKKFYSEIIKTLKK